MKLVQKIGQTITFRLIWMPHPLGTILNWCQIAMSLGETWEVAAGVMVSIGRDKAGRFQVENASVTAWKPAGRQDPRNGRRGA